MESSDANAMSSASEGVLRAETDSACSRKMSTAASPTSSSPKTSTVVFENSRLTNSVTKMAAGNTTENSTRAQKRSCRKTVASDMQGIALSNAARSLSGM
ncbi:hypothetical protein [Variovorax sp. OV329]|uniref:hypothetical protein n=1 Tax=Variovorax sp. OV329 TaxID=1882825 RepID=UPI0008E93579|nr:hypothetical protein [Variovorax sp. OV329]SFM18314.1 hypothetical protein SAMN05444747_103203 [Variovorax sp. OV329]